MKLENKLLPCRKLGMVVRFSVQTMGKWELCFVQKMQVVFGAENGSYFWCIIWENGIGFWCIKSSCFLVHKMEKWEISLCRKWENGSCFGCMQKIGVFWVHKMWVFWCIRWENGSFLGTQMRKWELFFVQKLGKWELFLVQKMGNGSCFGISAENGKPDRVRIRRWSKAIAEEVGRSEEDRT